LRKATLTAAVAAIGSLALAGTASAATPENWATHSITQQSIVKLYNSTGGTLQGKKPVTIDAYLSTRDPQSPKAAKQSQAVATVDMTFPAGATVNAIGTCKLWPTSKPWDLKKNCGSAKIGEGWALVSGLGTTALHRLTTDSNQTTAPSATGNYKDAPADCLVGDATQYSRTYETATLFKSPLAGLSCTPQGFTWVHISAYAGMGNGAVDAATGKVYDRSDSKKKKAAAVTDKKAIVFANDNGVAAISFAGTIKTNSNKTVTLHVDLPAFNSAGLKGYLPLDADLVDFRFVLNSTKYITAGACPSNKQAPVVSKISYSPFPGDYSAGNTSVYPLQTISSANTCK